MSRITDAHHKKPDPLGIRGLQWLSEDLCFFFKASNQIADQKAHLKNRGPAWARGPWKARSVAGVVFTPARGVTHPSFPLRGRWERPLKSTKQAPSPSLATLQTAVMWNAPTQGLMHGVSQSVVTGAYYISVLISNI